jgi:hypothetical protein
LWLSLNNSFGSQVYKEREVNEARRSSHPLQIINNGYDIHAAIHLQLSQPQSQHNEAQEKRPKSGYLFQITDILYNFIVY